VIASSRRVVVVVGGTCRSSARRSPGRAGIGERHRRQRAAVAENARGRSVTAQHVRVDGDAEAPVTRRVVRLVVEPDAVARGQRLDLMGREHAPPVELTAGEQRLVEPPELPHRPAPAGPPGAHRASAAGSSKRSSEIAFPGRRWRASCESVAVGTRALGRHTDPAGRPCRAARTRSRRHVLHRSRRPSRRRTISASNVMPRSGGRPARGPGYPSGLGVVPRRSRATISSPVGGEPGARLVTGRRRRGCRRRWGACERHR